MTLRLPVQKTVNAEAGRSLVRLPLDHLADLGLSAGDTVAITAARTTHARVIPAPQGRTTMEVSPAVANNCGAGWGEPADVVAAPLPRLKTALVKLGDGAAARVADLSESLFDLPLTEGDRLHLTLPLGQKTAVEIIALDPSPAGLFAESSSVTLHTTAADTDTREAYATIGGLHSQIARVHEMVAVPLRRPDLFARLGVPAPRGVLFTGPPGSGKTLLARAIAAQTSAAFYQIDGPEVVSKHYGESEAALRKVFEAAEKNAPAIIFLDEIDAIAPRRDGLSGEKQVERRVVAQLLTLMDGLADRGQVIVMAATNLPDGLDPALRRPGRFDREIAFRPPTPAERAEILQVHLHNAPLASDIDIPTIAAASHGYVGADLAALAREASLAALDRAVTAAGGEDGVQADQLFLTQSDLRHGLTVTHPSALRDTVVETPTVRFADIGGMAETKAQLSEAVIAPQQHRATYQALRVPPPAGVLLVGPPGTGKTLLARALASESGMNFLPVRPPQILSQFLGEAEKAIAAIFTKARNSAPCLLFFDELDALAPQRSGKDAVLDRIVAQLLAELDGLVPNTDVVILAATNRAAAIDAALTRPGRFDMIVPVQPPDTAARAAILGVHTKDLPLAPAVDLDAIAAATSGATGATLATIVQSAARTALQRVLRSDGGPPPADQLQITADDFAQAQAQQAASAAAAQSDFIRGVTHHDSLI